MTARVDVVYTVKHVARMTGIPADTVRMWERRYGVVEPARSEGGYRLYDETSVRRLAAMQALVRAGWSPRLAAEQVKAGAGSAPLLLGGDRSQETGAGVGGEGRPSLVPLAGDLHAGRLESTLTGVFASAPFEELVDDWLMPALTELGSAWRAGSVSVGGEHFVSAGLQRHVAGVLAEARPPSGAPRVIAGLARASRHELGILAFAAVLRRAGADVLYVGSDLPTESWVETARSFATRAVVLSVPTPEDVPGVRDAVAAVAESIPEVEIYLGGRHQDAVGTPARPLGHRVVPAVEHLVAELAELG
jgi:MerR family transcriptional regulator, light-induced transcriptional regulator